MTFGSYKIYFNKNLTMIDCITDLNCTGSLGISIQRLFCFNDRDKYIKFKMYNNKNNKKMKKNIVLRHPLF